MISQVPQSPVHASANPDILTYPAGTTLKQVEFKNTKLTSHVIHVVLLEHNAQLILAVTHEIQSPVVVSL